MTLQQSTSYVALLRGINVGGNNRILMATLRSLCTGLGWRDVQTYIQSGNIVFAADHSAFELEEMLHNAIESELELSIPVLVRQADDWLTYVKSNPFPEEPASTPNLVMLALSTLAPATDAVEGLLQRAAHGEQIVQVGDVLWLHFAQGVARSKLSPKFIDRIVGSTVTMRNWRTVQKLAQLAVQVSD